MFLPDTKKVLYPQSPFIPATDIGSVTKIISSIRDQDLHPVTAIATEVVAIGDLQTAFIVQHAEWIFEKFNLDEDKANDYFFGLIIPCSLIVGIDLMESLTIEEVVDILFPPSNDEVMDSVRDYLFRNLPKTYDLLDLDLHDPMESVKRVFDFCRLDVYSDGYWYLVGMEVGMELFQKFSLIFSYETVRAIYLGES